MDYEVILKVRDNVGEYGDDEYTEYENLKIKQNEINNIKSEKFIRLIVQLPLWIQPQEKRLNALLPHVSITIDDYIKFLIVGNIGMVGSSPVIPT